MPHYVGVDIHRKFLQVCVLEEDGTEVHNGRLSMRASGEIAEFFAQFHEDTQVVVEATMGWMWLSDLLQALGLSVHLAHMRGVRVIAESRIKTDKIDARVLAELLRTGFLPEAYLPPAGVREQRMLLRHRERVKK